MLGSVAAALSDFAALSYLSRKRERENACILSPRLGSVALRDGLVAGSVVTDPGSGRRVSE